MKCHCTIFHDWVARYGFRNMRVVTRYAEYVFLYPVGSAGQEVHFNASGAQNNDALFFILRCARRGCLIKCNRTHYTEPVFLHPVGTMGHVVHSGV
jgi:hypothetical protein